MRIKAFSQSDAFNILHFYYDVKRFAKKFTFQVRVSEQKERL
jgi:hypothetical protein